MSASPAHSSFERLVAAHQDGVYALAVLLTRDADVAADLAQDAFVRLWTRGADVWPTADAPRIRAWLLRTVRNLALDHLRTPARRHAAPNADDEIAALCDDAPTPGESAEEADEQAWAVEALHSLREPYRSLLHLREVEGLAYDAIGTTLGLPLTTVKVYLHRGRAMLRDAYLRRTGALA